MRFLTLIPLQTFAIALLMVWAAWEFGLWGLVGIVVVLFLVA